jgi:tetratricopeptide (TPR) repeat protein
VVFSFDLNGFLKLFILIFFISALFDLRNLYPSETPVLLANGKYTYCDGFQIVRTIKFRKDGKRLSAAYDFYNNKNYGEAIKLFEAVNIHFINNDTLDIALHSFNKSKDYKGAKEFYTKLLNMPGREAPNSNNFCSIGHIESNLGDDELAMGYYTKSIALDGDNIYPLCNRAYTYNLLEKYTEAQADFDKALEINPKFAYAYSNRAFSKMKLKLYDAALADIDSAIAIDDKEAYAYRNLGVYYLEMEDYTKAMEQLQRARALDQDTHMIDDYIKIAEAKLNEK